MIVSDTSPLVYLAALGDFPLLRNLFTEVAIPAAVLREINAAGSDMPVVQWFHAAIPSWIHVKEIRDGSGVEWLRNSGLHAGESEAIVLAEETYPEALLMDDGDGVRAALGRRLNVIRTPGVYRLAKQRGIISSVRPKLDDLRDAGFWLRDEHYKMILRDLGE